jgi:hypothetical protein
MSALRFGLGHFAKNREAAGQDILSLPKIPIFWRAPFPILASRKNRESRFSDFCESQKSCRDFCESQKSGKSRFPIIASVPDRENRSRFLRVAIIGIPIFATAFVGVGKRHHLFFPTPIRDC